MISLLLVLPIIIPLIAGVGIYFIQFKNDRQRNVFTEVAVILNSCVILLLIALRPENALTFIRLTKDIGLSLRLDGLSTVFLALIAFLWPLASLYAFEYMHGEHSLPRFFAFYTMSFGITAGVALSGNLVTMYLFYELLTLVTVPLVAHEQDKRSMDAARKYILYSIGGAALSFVGIMMLTSRAGLSPFVYGGLGNEKADTYLLVAYLFTFAGFGVKAAIFPLCDWLPSAGVAPTPVTALLHAVAVVKSGVFACIRSTFYAFGPQLLSGTWAQHAALIITALTIVFGSVMAYREQHWKRRLAYSTVSNLSYILFGVVLMTAEGLIAALSHMLFHGIMKITLFFCAGTVLCKTGREYVTQTEGLGRRMPLTFAVFTVAGLALTGTPLLPGFISKLSLLSAAASSGFDGYKLAGMIALVVSALFTAAYLIPMSIHAFLPRESVTLTVTENDKDPGLCMLIPFAVLCITMFLLGTNATAVFDVLRRLIGAGIQGGI